MRLFITLFFLLLSFSAYSQFRMVGTGLFYKLPDSSYQATISFRPDLTGFGYNPTQIDTSMYVLSQKGQLYKVDSIYNATFSAAILVVREHNGSWGSPVGQIMVFKNNSSISAPQVPYGSNGSTANMQAGVDTWNSLLLKIVSDSSYFWNLAYSNTIDSAFFSGDTLKTLNLLRTSGDTLKASFVQTGGGVTMPFDSISFNTAYTSQFGTGVMAYDTDNETVSVGIDGGATLQLGQELYYPLVINKSGSIIKNGTPVMVDTATLTTGDHVRVMPAKNNGIIPSNYIMGVATTDIENDSTGLVTWFGYVREVKESDIAQTGITLNAGDILYISATEPGKYTNVRPSSPAHQSTVALVVRKPSVNNITLLVRPWLAPKLDNLSNVNVTSVTGLSVLRYNSTTGIWDASATSGIVAADTSAMLSYYQKKLTNPVTGTGTAGQVSYWSGTGTQAGSNNLFWDNTNARLGIGTNAPGRNLQINGIGLPSLHITNTISGATSTDGVVFGIVDSNVVLNNFEPGYINFGTSDTSRMLIFRNGNINIGNALFTDLGYKLYVAGKVKSTNTIEGVSFAANTSTPQRTIHANVSTGLSGLILTNNTSGATSTDGTQLYTDGINTAIGNFENGYLAFLTNATERMRITNGGFFGLLKNNPSYTLDINATDAIRLPSGTTVQRPTGAAGVLRFNSDSTGLEYHNGTSWRGIVNTWDAGTGGGGSSVWSETADTVYLPSGKYVGIGTASPDQKLHIDGGAKMSKVILYSGVDTLEFSNYAPSGSVGGNLIMGNGLLSSTSTAFGNIAIGLNALLNNTDGVVNTAIGANTLTDNTTGQQNLAIGSGNLYKNTTGRNNIAIGTNTAYLSANPMTGSYNTFIGGATGRAMESGSNNVFIGQSAGVNFISGSSNLAIGEFAHAYPSATGNLRNVAIGSSSLAYVAGNLNVAIGFNSGLLTNAGSNLTSASGSVFIGNDTRASAVANSNEIVIGGLARGQGSNTIMLGNSSISSLYCYDTSISSPSDERDKTDIDSLTIGLEFLKKLNPVAFTWNARDGGKVGQKDVGFIAQQAMPAQAAEAQGLNLNLVEYKESTDQYFMQYSNLIPVLVKAIQEQQTQIDALKAEIEGLKNK